MLTELTTWWKEKMRGLIPASLHSSNQAWRRALIVVAEKSNASTVDLHLLGRGRETPLGRHDLTGTALRDTMQRLPAARRRVTVLRIAPELFLERDTIVPLAAERALKRVIGYDMDRLTPFQAGEVFWNCLITKRDTDHNRLYVRVTIVPKIRLQSTLDALHRAGIVPTRIEADGDAERRHTIPLVEARTPLGWLGPRTNTYALAGCSVLAATAVALPFILQTLAQNDIERRITAMRPQLTEAEKLRKTIASGATTTDLITGARNQVGSPLQSIALLTEMLPDDTYLTLLTIRQHKLSVSGRSAAAARLIGALAANSLLQNPAFAAPVLRDETNGGETFSIRVEVGS